MATLHVSVENTRPRDCYGLPPSHAMHSLIATPATIHKASAAHIAPAHSAGVGALFVTVTATHTSYPHTRGSPCLSQVCISTISINTTAAQLTLLLLLQQEWVVDVPALLPLCEAHLEAVDHVDAPAVLHPQQAADDSRGCSTLWAVGLEASEVVADVDQHELWRGVRRQCRKQGQGCGGWQDSVGAQKFSMTVCECADVCGSWCVGLRIKRFTRVKGRVLRMCAMQHGSCKGSMQPSVLMQGNTTASLGLSACLLLKTTSHTSRGTTSTQMLLQPTSGCKPRKLLHAC